MTTYSPPIVGVGPHSGDPHYEPGPATDAPIEPGDFVLIDLWAKLDRPRAVYSDLTRVGVTSARRAGEVREDLRHRRRGPRRRRSHACKRRVRGRASRCTGWEVDDATRAVIEKAGYGDQFIHRTGHNIGQEVHGNGAHMDGLETRDDRRVMPRTCFSIEPGIYLPEFGVRSEVNVYIDADGKVHVTGGELQTEVVRIG